jgi:hypothetical protein
MDVPTTPFIRLGREWSGWKGDGRRWLSGFYCARRFLSMDLAPSEGETAGARPGEEVASVRDLGGRRWLSVVWQRPEIGGRGFG